MGALGDEESGLRCPPRGPGRMGLPGILLDLPLHTWSHGLAHLPLLKRRCASRNVPPAPSTPCCCASSANAASSLARSQQMITARVVLGVQVKERNVWLATKIELKLKTTVGFG